MCRAWGVGSGVRWILVGERGGGGEEGGKVRVLYGLLVN